MNIKVSVVIPVYNCRKYLERCVESLLRQSLPNIEIILVNDGSNDGSADICHSLSKKYDNIILIEQENSGAAKARKVGIKIARGEFIGFVDSDDWVHERMFETLYTEAKKNNSDIVQCGFYSVNEFAETIEFDYKSVNTRAYSSKEAIMQLFCCRKNAEFNSLLWNKLFAAHTLKNIDLPTYHKANNDVPVIPRAFYEANRVSVFDQQLVYYFSRHDEKNKSISDINNATLSKKVQSHILAFRDISEYFRDKDEQLYEASLRQTVSWSLTALIHKNITNECRQLAKKTIKEADILKNPYIPLKKKMVGLVVQLLP